MPMQVETGIDPDMSAVSQRARDLEQLGYDFISITESQRTPFLPLTLVAEHTERIRFGTAVAIAFPRAPYITANTAWDLSRFSGGRFVLGLGTQVKGHNERRFSVPWVPPGPRLRDYVQCMRAIWDAWQNGTAANFESEHYQYKLNTPAFNPGPIEHPDIKVVLAALNPYNARLAGEVGDGIALHGFITLRYLREVLLPALHEGARRAGKNPDDLIVSGGGMVVTARTQRELEQTKEAARRQLSFYGSTRSYAGAMRLHGWDDEAARLHRLSIEGKWDEMVDVVSDEMMEEFCVFGTWDEIAGKVRERYAGINTRVDFDALPRNPDEAAQIKDVIAELQAIPAAGEV